MTKIAAPIQRMMLVVLVSGLCLGLPALAMAGVAAAPPLSGPELAAVTREIDALVHTPEAKVDQFVVRDATPERIDRFFSTAGLAQQPRVIRENGLALAGQGALLTFDKPSADLDRELDCTAKSADMGEISANVLSYFSNSPQAKQPAADGNIAPADTAADSEGQAEPPACNAVLVGSILEQKLGIDFGGGEDNGGRGDLLALVCKAHPTRPAQTIVALFHHLKNKRGENEEGKKGFAVAVIDARRRMLHSLHRDTIEEDALIRVSSGTLRIDTARYNLAPGVRAFGVRMNIGYNPRCGEGGENDYLTLFVEEGKQLRPVLSALPMSSWQVKEGSQVCGDGEAGAEIENTSLTLALSSSATDGWRDLDVVAQKTQDTATPDGGTAVANVGKPELIARFRKKGKVYLRQ